MTKVRSFRLTGPNEIKLKELVNKLMLDNENRTLNYIIECWHEYIIRKPIIDAIIQIEIAIENLKKY